uniref:Uncharacterized protein n=1 Tax=Arundo donax TaxID=35708 RepID=A0A0A9AA99_ARUDO
MKQRVLQLNQVTSFSAIWIWLWEWSMAWKLLVWVVTDP